MAEYNTNRSEYRTGMENKDDKYNTRGYLSGSFPYVESAKYGATKRLYINARPSELRV